MNDGSAAADTVSWAAMLRAMPVRNAAAQAEERADGTVRVTVRKKRPAFLKPPLSWAIRPRPTVSYELDRIGARVWRLCDGQRTVEAVVDDFAASQRLSFHEARVAVSGYIGHLVQRAAVVLVMESKGCPAKT
jgi:hypothetical protein